MLRKFVLSNLAFAALMTTSAAAQDARDPRCVDPSYGVVGIGGIGGDACQKVVDLFNYLTPQLGSAVAGGNATLGQAGTLGGPGRFAVELRVTAVRGALPNVDATGTSAGPAATPSSYAVEEKPLPVPAVDASVGLFAGIPLGLTTVLGLDALGSAYFVPEYEDDGIAVTTPDGSLAVGYGARLGLVGETAVLPGVSVTWMRRELPSTSIIGQPSAGDEIALEDFENRATSWRVVAGKRFGVIGLAAGYGKDSYESTATLSYHVQQGTIAETQGSFAFGGRDVKATSYFGNVMFNLLLAKAVVEVGQVTVDNLTSADFFNQFAEDIDASRLYASIGIRIGR